MAFGSYDNQGPLVHEYSFRWTPREYVRACHAITLHVHGTVPVFTIYLSGALLLFVSAPFATGNPSGPLILTAVGTAFLIWAAYLWWGGPWLTARRSLREDPCAKDDVRHIVSPEGFGVRTGALSIDVKWAHITQIVETKEFMLFYFTKRAAYFTPKRVIPDTELESLRSLLLQVLGDRARLSSVPVGAA